MKFTSSLAIAAALAVGAACSGAPALAQKKGEEKAQPKLNLSKAARPHIAALQTAVGAGDAAGYQTSLAAAQAAAATPDDRYIIARLQLLHAQKTKDDALKLAATDAAIRSGGAPAEELPLLYRVLGTAQYTAKNYEAAATAFEKLAELQPNNPESIALLADARSKQNRPGDALGAIERAIAAQKAAGQKVSENWYRLGLRYAIESKQPARATGFSRDLLAAYPSPTNWRDSLIVYRDAANLDKDSSLDLMRLMRATKSLKGDADYYELGDLLEDRGLPGETKALIDEGIAARAIDSNKPIFKNMLSAAAGKVSEDRASLAAAEKKAAADATGKAALVTADAYFGYGEYAKAAALYRTALQKGSVDANLVNTRLGIALAYAGQKAEAEAAFKAVTGARAEIASFWMLWLAQRA
jgi:tetratricopeptide (TPR) repeat protein